MTSRLNPMRLLQKGPLTSIVKVAGGVYLYHVVSTQVDTKWQRWAIYGGLALFGIYAPISIAALNQVWPTWENLDNETSMPPINPPSD